MKRSTWPLLALTGAVGFFLGLVAMRSNSGEFHSSQLRSPGSGPPLVVQESSSTVATSASVADFASVAARLNSSVVNVDAAIRGDARGRAQTEWRRDLADDPTVPREGTGSGFIIDSAGYILTNFHVIDGADRLTITLGDGRAFKAEVAGVDPAMDVALLKIDSAGPLPVAVLGDSAKLRVGQWVCAIGNPLGYVHSVTVGVVSFLGRKLFDQTLDAYIQTDAAISLGNSGGPLIDADGRVIGITTAISSQAANIGFAIPISQVVAILPQLRERGRVSRGYVDVSVTRVTPVIEHALGLTVDLGALVQSVGADSTADRAGLRAYDVIVAVDGNPVQSDEDLIRQLAARAPGTATTLEVVRENGRQSMTVKLTERPVPASAQGRMRKSDARQATGREQGPLGLTVRDLDPASPFRKALPESIVGVVVVDVDPAGPARLAHVRPGQVILEVNRHPTQTAAAFQTLVMSLAPGEVAAAMVYDPITDQRNLVAIIPDRRE
jgi:serine protease Do